MKEKIIALIEAALEVPSGTITEDTMIAEVEEWDSLAHVMIIGELEEQLGFSIRLEEALDLTGDFGEGRPLEQRVRRIYGRNAAGHKGERSGEHHGMAHGSGDHQIHEYQPQTDHEKAEGVAGIRKEEYGCEVLADSG